jgi:hypothetical protein
LALFEPHLSPKSAAIRSKITTPFLDNYPNKKTQNQPISTIELAFGRLLIVENAVHGATKRCGFG